MNKTKIIAELAWGHDGSIDQAIEILEKSKDSGADIISIHVTSLPDYMVPYYGSGEGRVSSGRESLEIYKYLSDINIKNEDWIKFKRRADELGLLLSVMPNDLTSLDFSEKYLNPEYYVISSACFVEEPMLIAIATKQKKTLFRIGGAYLGEIENAVNIFRKHGNEQIILLHGFQNYPTALEDTNISLLPTLQKIFNVEVGLADHIDGGSVLANIIPILAICYNATYIEKHITLDRMKKSEDFESALNPEDFKNMVSYIRSAEIAIGNSNFPDLSPSTLKYRLVSRKKIVAWTNIKAGETLSLSNLAFKRCDIGLTPDLISAILGRKVIDAIQQDDAITFEKLL